MPDRRHRQHWSFTEYWMCREILEAQANLKRVSYNFNTTYIEVTSFSMPPPIHIGGPCLLVDFCAAGHQ